MIPIQLIIEGLYSYRQRQTIDFAQLTHAGLFGIFGAVGSGKSSILEAISYALYGDTERLNARDKRSYNMMNLKSDRAYIAFDFYNHENKKFRATREFKRNSKNFEDVRPPKAAFYQWEQEKWLPLDHTSAEQIIGLTYTNFKRTIIIPQGQFKEFLELGATERTKMMKDIFNLQRYDLQDKVSELKKASQSTLDSLNGQLMGYEHITEEEIRSKTTALKTKEHQLALLQRSHDALEEKYRRLENLMEDFKTLEQKEADLSQLKKREGEIREQQKKLEAFEHLSGIFAPLFKDLKKNKEQLQIKRAEQKERTTALHRLTSQLDEAEKQLKAITPYFEHLADRKTEEQDLAFIISILTDRRDIATLEARTAKGKETVENGLKEEQEIQSAIEKTEQQFTRLKTQKPNAALLLEVGDWYAKWENLSAQIQKQTQKIQEKENAIRALVSLFSENQNQADPDNHGQVFEERKKALDDRKTILEKQKADLELHQKLSQYAHELQDGQPCPLCGAQTHPKITETQDLSAEIVACLKEIAEVENNKTKLQKEQSEFEKTLDRKKLLKQDLEEEKALLNELTNEMEFHQKAFTWKGFKARSPDDFREKKAQAARLEKLIEEVHLKLEQHRKAKENKQKQLNTYREALSKFKQEEGEKHAQIQVNLSNIKLLDFQHYRQKAVEEVQQILTALKEKNKTIEKQYQNQADKKNHLTPQIAGKESVLKELDRQTTALCSEIEELELQINDRLKKEHTDITTVQEALSLDLDISVERKQIEAYKIQFKTLQNGVDELAKKLHSANFSTAAFNETKEQWQLSGQKLQENKDAVLTLKNEVRDLNGNYEKKQELLKKQEKAEKRLQNLNLLFNLFKGAGFVQYVSSIYLSQLCDRANARFQKLTRNQLSLQLNESNDFEIVDYLNEGKCRSVKTLSGGQSFQVSLSLALALAGSVQANAKAEKNFFFIDEGFGTQDPASIDLIFETLLHLNREHKIVGIISHVEELKDRIPRSLIIQKDPEKGSRITYN